MALRPIGSDKASDPLGLRQMKDWGRGVASALGAATGAQENRSGGGTVASEQVAWAHADGFRAYFKHREEYSTSSKLVVTTGRVHTAKKTEQATATATEITLPSSGNLYVYVTYVMSATPTATITSNATQPDFHGTFATYNFVLGLLTETSTGKWSWASWHEGDIFLDATHYLSFWAKITGETAGSYSWKALQGDASTDESPARTGTTNATEVHGRLGIPTDTIVRMFPHPTDSTKYGFVDDSGEPGTAQDKSYTGEHQEAARTSTAWDRASQGTDRGTKRTVITGIAYYDTGDEVLYAYAEDWTFDADGHLVVISEERRVTIDIPEACSGSGSGSGS